MSIHFKSFNNECATVKEAQDADSSQESKLMRVNLQLNWCPSKSTSRLKMDNFSISSTNLQT